MGAHMLEGEVMVGQREWRPLAEELHKGVHLGGEGITAATNVDALGLLQRHQLISPTGAITLDSADAHMLFGTNLPTHRRPVVMLQLFR